MNKEELIKIGFEEVEENTYSKDNLRITLSDDKDYFIPIYIGSGNGCFVKKYQLDDFIHQWNGSKKRYLITTDEEVFIFSTRVEFENLFCDKDDPVTVKYNTHYITYYPDGKGVVWMKNRLLEMTNRIDDLLRLISTL